MSTVILVGETQRTNAISLIAALDLNKPWVVEIKKYVKKRTNPQLALYWEWIGIISNETGNDKDDLHELFKKKFLDPEIHEIMGETILRYTTEGDAKRMTEFMDRVLAFANSQLGIFLPLPSDRGRDSNGRIG